MIRLFLFTAIILLGIPNIQAQDVHFEYDNNGNRTSQEVIILKSGETHEDGNYPLDSSNHKIVARGEIWDITLFPNPVNSCLNIAIQGQVPDMQCKVEIFSTTGNILYCKENLENTLQIDFTSFRSGMYFLTITIEDSINTWKIIKQ